MLGIEAGAGPVAWSQSDPRIAYAAAGNPQAYVQLKAGHSQGTITERYIHAAQVLFPGAAERGEARIFGPSAEAD